MAPARVIPVPPQWFTVVMGTSIVATAAHVLPVRAAALDALAWGAWALAGAALVAVAGATAAHLTRDRQALRRMLLDPSVAPGYGAVAMGLLAYGTATLVVTEPALGRAAVAIDAVLWAVGTIIGLATAVAVPVLAFTRHGAPADGASGAWLMPVVPPMVSAAGGALLLPHLHGEAARTLALACYAMVGAAGIAALVLTTQLWSRLAHHQRGAAAAVPGLWLVLGPFGQGVTALGLLADHAGAPLGVDPGVLATATLLVGVPAMGFALLWLAIVAVITASAAREGLPFTLAWWGFTFPVGTLVTGAASLAHHSGAAAPALGSVVLFVLLLAGWTAAATGTARSLYAAVSSRFMRATQPGPWYTKAV